MPLADAPLHHRPRNHHENYHPTLKRASHEQILCV